MPESRERFAVSDAGFALPATDVLTGRGFITGKSGSGKSNTASVISEELLERNLPLLIIDTDGEYFGLRERYEVLHVGAEEECDLTVNVSDGQRIAKLALDENLPVILDVSGFLEEEESRELIFEVVKALFHLEKSRTKPFLLLVEEAHEFMPQGGGSDDLSQMLIRVAKRGRKRGLGIVAMSQRPAAVDKDFITQCDWIVWHRLTWDNDTAVADRILGDDAGETVQGLDDGEAIVMTDWDESVTRVQFRRKRTLDAGATPDLDDVRSSSAARHDLINELSDNEEKYPRHPDDGPATETSPMETHTLEDSVSGDSSTAGTGDMAASNPSHTESTDPTTDERRVAETDATEGGTVETGSVETGSKKSDSAETNSPETVPTEPSEPEPNAPADSEEPIDASSTNTSDSGKSDRTKRETETSESHRTTAQSEPSTATVGRTDSTPAPSQNRSQARVDTEHKSTTSSATLQTPSSSSSSRQRTPPRKSRPRTRSPPTPKGERATEDPVWEIGYLVVYLYGAILTWHLRVLDRIEISLAYRFEWLRWKLRGPDNARPYHSPWVSRVARFLAVLVMISGYATLIAMPFVLL